MSVSNLERRSDLVQLSDFDLQQLDEARLSQLTAVQKEALLKTLLADLKDARERLKAASRTSSRPPSSDAPWGSAPGDEEVPAAPPGPADETPAERSPRAASETQEPVKEAAGGAATEPPKRPGRRPGAVGHRRIPHLAVTETLVPAPGRGALCGQPLAESGFTARTGLYVLDLEWSASAGLCGLGVRHDKHL
jgi:transposase